MSRYAKILIAVALLALLYHQLGGFESQSHASGPDNDPDSPTAEPGALQGSLLDGLGVDRLSMNAESGSEGFVEPPQPSIEFDPVLTGAEEITIGRNESFYVALRRSGLKHETIMQIVDVCEPYVNLERVRPGDVFRVIRNGDDLLRMRIELDPVSYVDVERMDDELQATFVELPVQRKVTAVRGSIQTSLFEALLEKGSDPTLADQIAEILGWSIDFFRDLRVGDEFVAVYAEYTNGGQKTRDPELLAATFVNRGRSYRAYRFRDEHGLAAYFDETGGSLERQFLRAPLKFSRISSNFSSSRLHPVLKTRRPHWGVDFVAPAGTPVMATADGTVSERSRNGASGNFVGIRHGNGYESFYLHLSRFAKGLRVGKKVRQGDVIGYVGSTGWATAAHLDYRIKKNGKWMNPRRMSLPPAEPVPDAQRAEFMEEVARYDAWLESVRDDSTSLVLHADGATGPGFGGGVGATR